MTKHIWHPVWRLLISQRVFSEMTKYYVCSVCSLYEREQSTTHDEWDITPSGDLTEDTVVKISCDETAELLSLRSSLGSIAAHRANKVLGWPKVCSVDQLNIGYHLITICFVEILSNTMNEANKRAYGVCASAVLRLYTIEYYEYQSQPLFKRGNI